MYFFHLYIHVAKCIFTQMCTDANPKKRTSLHNIQKCQKSLIYKPDIQLPATSSVTGVQSRAQNALNEHTHATL